MKNIFNKLYFAALIIAAILLFTDSVKAQAYKSEPFQRELGLQIGKLPLTAQGLQRAIQSLVDSGVVYIAYPGIWDTTGVGAIPAGIVIKGWLFGEEVGLVNFDIDDSTGIAAYVEEALIGYATEEYVNTELIDKIDKNYSAYPGIPHPDTDALIPIFQNDTSGVTTVDKLPVSDATQTALNGKQDALVSGTNIKTINSESLLGSGNITIEGTVDTSDFVASKAYVENAINAIPEDSLGITGAEFNTWIDNFRGGTTNQIWKKDSNSDFDGSWVDNTGGSGSLADSQVIQLDMAWIYLNLDTTSSVTFLDSTGAATETSILSYITEVGVNDVVRIATSTGEYRAKSNDVWNDWTSATRIYKDVDSMQVRHTSSISSFTSTDQIITIGGTVDTFTVTTAVSGYTTDSLIYDYIYTSLTAGAVTANEWEDETASIPFTGADGTPTMVADSGVVFNNGDDLWRNSAVISDSVSIEMVIMLSDTTAVNGTWAKVRNGSGMEINSISSDPLYIFGVTGFDGSTHYKTTVYPTPLEGNFVHVAATFDGVSDPKVYFNNVLQDDFGGTAIPNVSTGDVLVLGYGTGSLSPNEIVRLFRVYTKVLTTEEINGNYGWAQSEGLVP